MPLDFRKYIGSLADRKPLTLNVRPLTSRLRGSTPDISAALDHIADAVEQLQGRIRDLEQAKVERLDITNPDGKRIAWVGSRDDKNGGAFEELYAGASAVSDPDNAEFKVADGTVAIQGAAFVIKQLLIIDLTLTDNSPAATRIAWSACTARYNGTSYSIASGNTPSTEKFIYWDAGNGTFTVANSFTPQVDRFLIATNTGGTADEAWNKVGRQSVQADHVPDGEFGSDKLNPTQIDVGGGTGKPGKFRVFDATPTQVGFIGVDGSDVGAWFKTISIGGTSYGTGNVKADASGNVSLTDATFAFTSDGFTTTIDNTLFDGTRQAIIANRDSDNNRSTTSYNGFGLYDPDGDFCGGLFKASSTPWSGQLYLNDGSGTGGILSNGEQLILTGVNGVIQMTGDLKLKGDATVSFDEDSAGSGLAGSAGASAGYVTVKHRGTSYKIEVFAVS